MTTIIKLLIDVINRNTALRFMISGGLNTLVTWLIYLMLLNHSGYKVSYTTAYVIGIFLGFLFNRFFVFRIDSGVISAILFPFVYLVQYLLGLLIVWVWVDLIGMQATLAPIASTILTIPVTFILSRYIFNKRFSA